MSRWRVGERPESRQAGVAQLVEQLIRNQQVTRSSRVAGSSFARKSAQLDRRVEALTAFDSQSDSLRLPELADADLLLLLCAWVFGLACGRIVRLPSQHCSGGRNRARDDNPEQ